MSIKNRRIKGGQFYGAAGHKKTTGKGGFLVGLSPYMVEVAGIEPASVNPTRTGDYMLSLCLKLTPATPID